MKIVFILISTPNIFVHLLSHTQFLTLELKVFNLVIIKIVVLCHRVVG